MFLTILFLITMIQDDIKMKSQAWVQSEVNMNKTNKKGY
jgi:hypothetical protein